MWFTLEGLAALGLFPEARYLKKGVWLLIYQNRLGKASNGSGKGQDFRVVIGGGCIFRS